MSEFETEFYGEKELRWYQIAAVNGTAAALRKGVKRILIVLPTGAGKTLTIAAAMSSPAIREALGVESSRPIRILFAALNHRLLSQAEQTFTEEANVEVITHSIFSDIPTDVVEKGWDVTILDESHHESCTSFQLQLEQIGEHPIIGLTATPDRADGCLIKFEEFINPISRIEAVEQGFLSETKLNSFVDTSGKNKVDIVSAIMHKYAAEMKQTMVFMRTKAEVRAINDLLVDMGYNSVAILDQSAHEFDQVLNDFSDGKIQFLVNCNKINEGVDVKGCSDVVLGRQFGSYPQLNQVIGRASRPDSECNVWELVNPFSGYNLDTTIIVGTPKRHRLIFEENQQWSTEEFNYVA